MINAYTFCKIFFRAIEKLDRLLLAGIQAWMRCSGENTTKAGDSYSL